MQIIGIDSGSTATKGVLFLNGNLENMAISPTGGNPKQAAASVLEELGYDPENCRLVTTGYGRKLIEGDGSYTEITCHARGARWICPEAKSVIDIGGQDSKVIKLNQAGLVEDFRMNDKCAAGTGRFIDVMLRALGASIEEMDHFVSGAKAVKINSMCTVFAESEVIGLIARGEQPSNVMAGVLYSVALRIANQFYGIQPEGPVLFTGGLALSNAFTEILEENLAEKLIISPWSQYTGAIGAALSYK